MELKHDFDIFLQDIRPTTSMLTDCQIGHITLRERLSADKDLQPYLVSDFLQGSYRRSTAVRPKNGKRSDVDIIVVTNLSESKYTPEEAMAVFEPFLDKHYKGKWQIQGRSFGIELTHVDIDLVITSAPSESEYGILTSDAVKTDEDIMTSLDWRLNLSWLSLQSRRQRFDTKSLLEIAKEQEEWRLNPLRIPNRDANIWEDTHPLEQIRWTRDKNKNTDGYFVNVAKCVKWWWLEQFNEPQPPKGFPLERIVGDCCPNGITSVAEGLVSTLETIVSKYGLYVTLKSKPQLPDYGVPGHDVLKRVTSEEFAEFYHHINTAALLARRAYDSTDRKESVNFWRELLGNKFPPPPDNGGSKHSGYTPPNSPAVPGSGRFA
ncbi:MAG: nucleotidyltransferase [Bacillota bacterium]